MLTRQLEQGEGATRDERCACVCVLEEVRSVLKGGGWGVRGYNNEYFKDYQWVWNKMCQGVE